MASGGENYGYSVNNNTIEVPGWSNGNSVGNISNAGVGNGNKTSAQSAQEQQPAPVPSPRSEVQPSSGGNNGYSHNDGNSVGNIGKFSNTRMGSRNKISAQSAQEQVLAPVPTPRSGVQPSNEGNCGYSASRDDKISVSGLSNGNSFRNISNTGVGNGNKISAQSAQGQLSAPVPSPSSRVVSSGGGNYGYSATANGISVGNIGNISNSTGVGNRNKISAQSAKEQPSAPVPSPSRGVQPSRGENYGYCASGDNNGNSVENVGNISNTGVGNHRNKISAQLAQEQQSAPVPVPTLRIGVQPSNGGNYGYNASDDNNKNSLGNISNTGVGSHRNKISAQLAQEQQSAPVPVPSLRIGVQPSNGGNYGYNASDDNNKNSLGNISNGTGVGNRNKKFAQLALEQQSARPVPSPWSGVQPSDQGNYGHSASGNNEMSVSGWSKGNSVGNIRNTGVGTNNSESTPRRSCCSCLICS